MNNNGSQIIANRDIFERMRSGELIRLNDAQYPKIQAVVDRTIQLNATLNTSETVESIRKKVSEVTGSVFNNNIR